MKKAFCSWSGGKESALAFYKAKNAGIDVSYLVNMVSEDGSRSRSHGVNSELLRLQAESIGSRIVQTKTTWETYEELFKNGVRALKEEGVEAGIFGDIDLPEHRDWVERVCGEIGVEPILPLWGMEREELLKELVRSGFKAIVISTPKLGKEWFGREITEGFIEDLKVKSDIDLCGEKGEYHTFVCDGPIFSKKNLLCDVIIYKPKPVFSFP